MKNLEGEVWCDVPTSEKQDKDLWGWGLSNKKLEQMYFPELENIQVSNMGRVKHKKGYKKRGDKRYTYLITQTWNEARQGYIITYKGKKYDVKMLVYYTFMSNYKLPNGYSVKHINFDTKDNRLDNLIECDAIETQALVQYDSFPDGKIDLEDEDFLEYKAYIERELGIFLNHKERKRKDYLGWMTGKAPKHPNDRGIWDTINDIQRMEKANKMGIDVDDFEDDLDYDIWQSNPDYF